MLMLSGFDTSNYGSSIGEFMPYGSAPIFAATTTSGIIFSFNAFQIAIPRAIFFSGFLISDPILMIVWNALNEKMIPDVQTIINMGSEIKNPEKNIARGIAISLTLSAILYIDVVVAAKIGALPYGINSPIDEP
jgi:amino acid transporter